MNIESIVESDTVRARAEKRRRISKAKLSELTRGLGLVPLRASSGSSGAVQSAFTAFGSRVGESEDFIRAFRNSMPNQDEGQEIQE